MFSKIKSLMSKDKEIVEDEMERDAFITDEDTYYKVEKREILENGKKVIRNCVIENHIVYPVKYGFIHAKYIPNAKNYVYLSVDNVKRNLHLVVYENRKKQYMNNKKYKYVDVVWKFIESYNPLVNIQKKY
mgnify:CR=1 FL=1|tara:strand:+ start:1109 stop:1501 length:393 start_codon:yes stop_codon:yes gene_type:complete